MAKKGYTFSGTADIFRRRNAFNLSHSVKTAVNVGELVPLPPIFVYPGDTFKDVSNVVARVTSSFLKPVMDNAFIDMYAFFVPYRLVWKDWEDFITGGSNPSAYSQPFVGKVPSIVAGSSALFVSQSTVMDYLGIPSGMQLAAATLDTGISILPARAYAKIYNDWFRNENLVDEVLIQTGSFVASELPNDNPASSSNYTGKPFKVSKLDDYFTSCLPQPQKGPGVDVPLGQFTDVPVVTKSAILPDNQFGLVLGANGTSFSGFQQFVGMPSEGNVQLGAVAASSTSPGTVVYPKNLYAETSKLPESLLSVSDLRFAVQLQRLYERLARTGSRYTEYLQAAFGVVSSDSRLQRAEFLGGKRIPLSVQQVAQTSAGTSTSPQANLSAFSQSSGFFKWNKSFTEHGIVMFVLTIRQYHTYQQGIRRDWLLLQRTQFYDPVFAHLSEQPVYQKEIFASASKDNVFGYNEPFAFIRYIPNSVTGEMRSSAENTLDIWHFADNYENAPVLSQDWVQETDSYVDRTLSVSGSKQKQFILDIYHKISAYRVAPLYGTPGLVDHN